MHPQLNIILKAIGVAAVMFLVANAILFIVELIDIGREGIYQLRYKWGTFYLNHSPIGFVWGTAKSKLFILAITLLYVYRNRQKDQKNNPD